MFAGLRSVRVPAQLEIARTGVAASYRHGTLPMAHPVRHLLVVEGGVDLQIILVHAHRQLVAFGYQLSELRRVARFKEHFAGRTKALRRAYLALSRRGKRNSRVRRFKPGGRKEGRL